MSILCQATTRVDNVQLRVPEFFSVITDANREFYSLYPLMNRFRHNQPAFISLEDAIMFAYTMGVENGINHPVKLPDA